MKTLKWSLLVVLVAGVVVSTVMLRTRLPCPFSTDVNGNEGVVYQPVPLATAPLPKLAVKLPLPSEKEDVLVSHIASQPASVMRVRAESVLAKINGRAILLKDLVPLRPDEEEQAMTSEEYESRLNRAIEMELTFQAAAARRVELTLEQKRRVDAIAQRHEATLQEYRKQGVTWSSATAAQLEFQKRLTSALLLQQNLVAMAAHVAPASDASVQARYERARNEVLNHLKAQGNISVSTAEL
jgi:hypothetical protein